MNQGYKLLMVAALIGAAAAARADLWVFPSEQNYYSENDAYYLRVVPGNGDKDASATLYEVVVDAEVGGDALKKWSRDLENPVAPHKVLVADSGEYVVTFGDWGRVGYGPNVVVIYGPEGEIIHKYALEEILTEEEINAVTSTTSSRFWAYEHNLDEDEGLLHVRIGYADFDKATSTNARTEITLDVGTGDIILSE